MNPWKITSINNATHAVELTHQDGEKFKCVIPETHRGSTALKQNFLKSLIDEKDKARASIAPANQAIKSKCSYLLYAFLVIQAIAIMALLLRH